MRAFVVTEHAGELTCSVRDVEPRPEPDDVLVEVEYSGINFKDAMVASVPSRVRRVESLVAGVDAAGRLAQPHDGLDSGTPVVAVGGAIGTAKDGGFATELWVAPRYLTPLPRSLSTRDAMAIGTAGYTAMASVLALEDHGLEPGGSVLVTGATGGVGSQAITYLALRGYRPVASTGSGDATEWLSHLGAVEVIGRDDISDRPDRVLARERWDGAIDCVGGATLHEILRSLKYGAAVAASGLVASAELTTSVYPFITRAVALLGVDAVMARPRVRERVWRTLGDLAPRLDVDAFVDREIGLDEVASALQDVRRGATRGRVLVDVRRPPTR